VKCAPGAKSAALVPVPPSLTDHHALADRLALPHLEMVAHPAVVPLARHHARQLLWDLGLRELIDPVELVVSEIVTNAIRASAGYGVTGQATEGVLPVVRLWLSIEENGVLVLVWDASSSRPEQRAPQPDADSGRGLLLVGMLSEAWGSFEIASQPGKVVWARCAASGAS
jgi:anti-sigma regulatory factor (Ser/Thr protein kinase)